MSNDNTPQEVPETVVEDETQVEVTDTTTTEEVPVEAPKTAEEIIRENYDFAAKWPDSKVRDWHRVMKDAATPFLDDGKTLAYDPMREERSVSDWTLEELIGFVEGKLIKVSDHKKAPVIKELARHIHIEAAWSNDEVLDYFRKGIEPKKTSNGVWVNDVTRKTRSANDWSNRELEAWAAGEIKPHGVATPAHLAKALKDRMGLNVTSSVPETVIEQYQKEIVTRKEANTTIANKGLNPMNTTFIESTLTRYASATAPGQHLTDATGGRAQRELEGLFQYVLKLEGPALLQGMDMIKVFVGKHRDTTFSPTNAYRFVHMLKGDKRAQRRHVNFIELFRVVTDSNKGRRKQTDIKEMLREHPPLKQNILLDYFRNYA